MGVRGRYQCVNGPLSGFLALLLAALFFTPAGMAHGELMVDFPFSPERPLASTRLFEELETNFDKVDFEIRSPSHFAQATYSRRTAIRFDDENVFTLAEVEEHCRVTKYSTSYGDIECSGRNLGPVEEHCKARFHSPNLADIECSHSTLRVVEHFCDATFHTGRHAKIGC